MQRLRSKLFDISLAVWTGLFTPALAILWLCGSPERGVRVMSRLWARGVLIGLNWLVGLTYAERGRHNIPGEPCLIVANHQSTWETLAFLILFPDVAIVAKQELLTIPVFSWFLRKSPMILIDRESGPKAVRKMVDESRAAIAQGRSVLIFPEGTRKSVSEPIAFKRGVELLYAKLDRPVLPVALNSGHFWGPGQRFKRGGTVAVTYLAPIPPGLSGSQFTRTAEQLLEAERSQSWPQAA
ncbi:1-acyl-sn-glycerol-3-phosphate acyltransferase [Microvirga sp. 17 mud 1-3]|uniref:lysophospholipid acyltransferase family protein n=1 Tax=Microvirga sp. 17 mud 1-3 TaxID=2082949 RepID=UPI000D6D2E33|nr:lysophospholipid acyltransferase family protein [Microvirga sp. 17 mud 1-3]AWM86988.1 1-acyl-sn-glycerol-3-phosphate acyltransferase [Microvirga sp. 17 mud 1-3]